MAVSSFLFRRFCPRLLHFGARYRGQLQSRRCLSSANDRGLNAADPELRITWPVSAGREVISEKDRALPMLKELPIYFIESVGQ